MGLSELRELSNRYGRNPDYVLAGGGNTSYKDAATLYVKGSGTSLATIDESGFPALRRDALAKIFDTTYPAGEDEREAAVLADLMAARVPGETRRPSVETLLHDIIPTAYVLHLHPAAVNGLTCARGGRAAFERLFAQDGVWVPPIMPGYVLADTVRGDIAAFEKTHGAAPAYIFLENHGVFTGGDTVAEVDARFEELLRRLNGENIERADLSPCDFARALAAAFAPAVRCLVADPACDGVPGVAVFSCNKALMEAVSSREAFSQVYLTFSPDHMVYCRDAALYLEADGLEALYDALAKGLAGYEAAHGAKPRVVGVKGLGVYACGSTKKEADTIAAVFLDAVKVSVAARAFGGGKPMPETLVKSILNWEVERYRRSVSFTAAQAKRLNGRVAVVTGSAQGFGQGLASGMAEAGAYIVVADLNGPGAESNAAALCEKHGPGAAIAVQGDVTKEDDVRALFESAALAYGGVDILVNNAGIVRAGSLEEMTLPAFNLVTNVNYAAYFLCVKYASAVMKLQHRFAPDYMMDVIEVNSKSGLSGSNKNFAYAGSKFGGIGLTQSFALELVPYCIKVNALCPGNFLDGPLWRDPERGLLVQYLKAGKVPGAKTTDDVLRHYENQVPMRRGCRVEDVLRALFYCVEQKYETGQAIPVTGGQEMLK